MSGPLWRIGYSLGVILAGLSARAVIDKLLALSGGATAVAHWAQLQSVVDMVIGVVAIGLAQGLTVLVAQQTVSGKQHALFRHALAIGGALTGLVAAAIGLVLLAGPLAAWWPHAPSSTLLAALTGWLGVPASLVAAYWLGRHRQDRVFWLSVLTLAPPALAAAAGAGLNGLLAAQAAAGLLVVVFTLRWLRDRPGAPAKWHWPEILASGRRWRAALAGPDDTAALWRFVPVGLVIGLASPLSQVLARGEISAALSWHDAGVMQAVWRAAEWVTAFMAGILSLYYLPGFSRVLAGATGPARRRAFVAALGAAAGPVLGITAVLLAAVWLNQRAVLALLYDSGVAAGDLAVGLFLLGDGLRVASWVILFGLLALRATVWVSVGEFFSLPLFALLVATFADGMSLTRAGGLYAATYLVYLLFNLCGLRSALGRAG